MKRTRNSTKTHLDLFSGDCHLTTRLESGVGDSLKRDVLVALPTTGSRITSKIRTIKHVGKLLHAEMLALCLSPSVILHSLDHLVVNNCGSILAVVFLFSCMRGVNQLLRYLCADGVSGVNEKPTFTTDPLPGRILSSLLVLAHDTLLRLFVPTTRFFVSLPRAFEPEETVLAPVLTPAVADVPVTHGILLVLAEAHQNNCMVDNIVTATSNHTIAISEQPISSNGSYKRPNSHKSVPH